MPHFFLASLYTAPTRTEKPNCVGLNEHSLSVISSLLPRLVPVSGLLVIFYTAGRAAQESHITSLKDYSFLIQDK